MQILRLRSWLRFAVATQWRHHSHPSGAFEYYRDPLPHANAHGAKSITAIYTTQLINCRGGQARTAGAQWMTDGDCATIGIHVRRIIRYTQFTKYRECL